MDDPVSGTVAEVERWDTELDTPFRPTHEIESLAPDELTDGDEVGALGEDELAELDDGFEVEAVEDEGAEEGARLDEWAEPELPGAVPEQQIATLDELVAFEAGAGSGLADRVRGVAAFALGPALRNGDRGPAVAALQRGLISLGHDLAVDGVFGPNTERAVRAFQGRAGIGVDGVVGPQTKAAISRALAGGAAPSPTPTPAPTPAPTPGPSGTPTDWTQVTGDARMQYVVNRLVTVYGYPVNGAAGLTGNLWAESAILPNRVEGSRPQTPMRAADFTGRVREFSPAEIKARNFSAKQGPRRPGIGLAQWTSRDRRAGLFRHTYQGQARGDAILFDMDAQIDYLVTELRTRPYAPVNDVLTRPGVRVAEASDEVVYRFEIPGRVIGPDRRSLPRQHPQVQEVFAERRAHSERALRAYLAAAR